MKIQLAEHYGLCFGVRDAIQTATQIANNSSLTILGELVHNPLVQEHLAQLGVQTAALNQTTAPTQQVMITAHGASNKIRNDWKDAGFAVSDATCPLVKHAHQQLAALVALGYFPVVIGKRGHVEVAGLTGDFPDAAIVETSTDVCLLPDYPRYGVISQTTQVLEKVQALVQAIREQKPGCEVRFVDTVCQPTKNRQTALGKLLASCDTMVVIGGFNSNNTAQLVAKARSAGLTAYHIERPEELDPEWFVNSQNVGLTAGTSTLKETVSAVHARLLEIAKLFTNEVRENETCRATN